MFGRAGGLGSWMLALTIIAGACETSPDSGSNPSDIAEDGGSRNRSTDAGSSAKMDAGALDAAIDGALSNPGMADAGPGPAPSGDGGAAAMEAGIGGDSAAMPGPVGAVPGLVSHWKFDEGPNQPINNDRYWIYDSLDRANTGKVTTTVAEIDWIDGGFPAATFPNPYAMHVRTGYVYLVLNSPTLPRINEVQTMSLWLHLVSSTSESLVIMWRAATGVTSGSSRASLQLRAGDGSIRVDVSESAASPMLRADGLSTGWHHVAYVYDGQEFRLYVDGVLSTSQSGTFSGTHYQKFLPSQFVASSAAMDDLRFYDRALNEQEILAISTGSQ